MTTRNKIIIKKLFISWLLPLIVAVLAFVVVRPVVAKTALEKIELEAFLAGEDVAVGVEIIDGYSQVYYEYRGRRVLVTKEGLNNIAPHTSGDYIVWSKTINGAGQIFRYHIPTETVMQVTQTSTNLEAKVDRKGRVAWERWLTGSESGGDGSDREGWQVFLFDGTKMEQLTSSTVAIEPDIDNGWLVYKEKSGEEWTVYLYDLVNQTLTGVGVGSKPELGDDRLTWLVSAGEEWDEKENRYVYDFGTGELEVFEDYTGSKITPALPGVDLAIQPVSQPEQDLVSPVVATEAAILEELAGASSQ